MITDKSIKRVTVGNTDIQRIMCGGGILWQKIYRWKKYRIINGTKDVVVSVTKTSINPPIDINEYDFSLRARKYKGYRDYEIKDGEIVLIAPIHSLANSGNIGSLGSSIYSKVNNKFAKGRVIEKRNGGGSAMLKYVRFTDYLLPKKEQVPNVSKGSYVSEVVSYNKNEYPDNGERDDFWYEFVE